MLFKIWWLGQPHWKKQPLNKDLKKKTKKWVMWIWGRSFPGNRIIRTYLSLSGFLILRLCTFLFGWQMRRCICRRCICYLNFMNQNYTSVHISLVILGTWSLMLLDILGNELELCAWKKDGVVFGVVHNGLVHIKRGVVVAVLISWHSFFLIFLNFRRNFDWETNLKGSREILNTLHASAVTPFVNISHH